MWEPGDHLSILARTKGGKSTLVGRGLLPLWDYSLTFDVKNDGSVPLPGGGRKVREYPTRRQIADNGTHHFRLAPTYGASAIAAFDDAFRKVWAAGRDEPGKGSWVLNLDELRILSDKLKMRDHIESLYVTGRSRGITIVASTQAPRDVPSEFYDQATYFAVGSGMRDIRTLDRIGEITGDRQTIRDIVPRLDWSRREFLFFGPDLMVITNLPKPPK